MVVICVLLICGCMVFARSTKPARHAAAKKAAVSSSAGHKTRKTVRSTKGKKRGATRKPVRSRGQQGIAADRATEIQEALIKAKYLDGEPSGVWDQETRSAMAKFQGDNGWQTKVVPDSRALIKLGLGPNHSDVINPETSLMLPQTTDTARQMVPGGATPQR